MHLGRPDASLTSPWTGLPAGDLRQWALDAGGWFDEEVKTGLTRRAPRDERDGMVLLSVQAGAPDVRPPGFVVARVPLTERSGISVARPGAHLKAAGLHVSLPRRLLAQRRLAAWVHAHADNAYARPFAGQAVVSGHRGNGGAVALDLVETAGDAPEFLAVALAYHALCDARDTGAVTARSRITGPFLRELGFAGAASPGTETMWRLRLAQLRTPAGFPSHRT